MRISDWSSDVCSSDLRRFRFGCELHGSADHLIRPPKTKRQGGGPFWPPPYSLQILVPGGHPMTKPRLVSLLLLSTTILTPSVAWGQESTPPTDRKSTRLNSSP